MNLLRTLPTAPSPITTHLMVCMVAAGRGGLETGAKWQRGCAFPPPSWTKKITDLFYIISEAIDCLSTIHVHLLRATTASLTNLIDGR